MASTPGQILVVRQPATQELRSPLTVKDAQGNTLLFIVSGDGGVTIAFAPDVVVGSLGMLTPDGVGTREGGQLRLSGADGREQDSSHPNNDGGGVALVLGRAGFGGNTDGKPGRLVVTPNLQTHPPATVGLVCLANPAEFDEDGVVVAVRNGDNSDDIPLISIDENDTIKIAADGSIDAGAIYRAPAGGSTDDWDRLFDASTGFVTIAAAAGRPTTLRAGTWRADTSQPSLASGTRIVLEPGTQVVSTLTAAMSYPGNYAFYFDTASATQTGTLAATPALGADELSVSITTKPAVGHFLQLTHGLSSALFEVLESNSVSSPWTVKIDRPTNIPWETGDGVAEYTSRTADCSIDMMSGATIEGGGNQYVQAFRADRVRVSGMRSINADASHCNPIGFDIACRQCLAVDCDLDLTGAAESLGAYAQSNEETRFVRVSVRNADTGVGVMLLDCVRSRIEDCHASGCAYGLSVSSFGFANGDDSLGCFDCVVSGSATGCGIGGLLAHVGPATNCSLVDFSAVGCTTVGLYVGAGSVGSTVARSSARACDVGMKIESGAVATRVRDVSLSDSTTTTFRCLAGVDVDGLTASGNHALGILKFEGTGTWRLRAVDITQSYASGFGVYVTGAGRLELDGCTISGTNEAALVIDAAATLVVRNLRPAASSQGIYVAAGATAILGDGVDLSACTSPLTGAGVVTGRFSGVSAITMTTANKTASWAEYAADVLIISGTLGAGRDLLLGASGTGPSGYRIPQDIVNNTDQTVTVKGPSGTGLAIASGAKKRGVWDGSNYVEV